MLMKPTGAGGGGVEMGAGGAVAAHHRKLNVSYSNLTYQIVHEVRRGRQDPCRVSGWR